MTSSVKDYLKKKNNKITTLFTLIVSLIFVQSQSVLAHGTKHPTRYIAQNGVDAGDCSHASKPCATITYAVELSGKGDKLQISKGEYLSTGKDIFYLLSGLVEIEAGFSDDDGFTTKDIKKNLTVFYGVPAEYRDKIQAMGFTVISDAKAQDIKISNAELKLLSDFNRMNKSAQSFAACNNGFAEEFECDSMELQARLPGSVLHSSSPSLNDIWGFVDLNDNKEYAIVGLTNGTTVIDVTDPSAAVNKGFVSGLSSTWRDLKVYQSWDATNNRYHAYAYVTTEASQGLQIIDLGDLPNSISLAATISDFNNAHNIYIANVDYSTGVAVDGLTPYIYVAGSNRSQGAFRVYDLTDPSAPTLVSAAPTGTGYVHDLTTFNITDSRTAHCANGHNPCEILVDFNEQTVDIWDMTDKQNPFMISQTGYTNAGYTHSGWWSQDKQFIFIQDELDEQNTGSNTTLRTLDISDLTSPFVSNVYTGPTQAIDHNGFTVGDRYYMSNYRRGLTVLDISNPNQPTEVGFFDTYPTPSANTATFAGAWGVYPFLPSGNILVSDSAYGLFIVKAGTNTGTPPAPTPNPTPTPTAPSGSGGGVGEFYLIMLLVLCYFYRWTAYRSRNF